MNLRPLRRALLLTLSAFLRFSGLASLWRSQRRAKGYFRVYIL